MNVEVRNWISFQKLGLVSGILASSNFPAQENAVTRHLSVIKKFPAVLPMYRSGSSNASTNFTTFSTGLQILLGTQLLAVLLEDQFSSDLRLQV